jgi:hypothetical protein
VKVIRCTVCGWEDKKNNLNRYVLPFDSTKWQCPSECGEVHKINETTFNVFKVPTKIYLQVLDREGEPIDPPSWDDERIFDTDIEYVISGKQSSEVKLGREVNNGK